MATKDVAKKDIIAEFEALDDDFGFWVWTKNALGAAAVTEIEKQLGFPLEPDYKAFVSKHGCAALQAIDEVWVKPKPFQTGPRWAHEYAIEVLGVAKDGPPDLDVRARAKALALKGMVPVAGVRLGRVMLAHDARGDYHWVIDGEVTDAENDFHGCVMELVEALTEDKENAKKQGAKLWG